jgi:hypothetical protein
MSKCNNDCPYDNCGRDHELMRDLMTRIAKREKQMEKRTMDTNPYGDHSPGQGIRMPLSSDIIAGVEYVPAGGALKGSSKHDNTHDGLINDANRIISGDRNAVYGDAGEDFTRTGKMWAAILGLDAVRPEQVALCMTALKIGRLCETPGHRDGWVDGIGYLALGGEIALNPEGAA